jgi:hypothetical protein
MNMGKSNFGITAILLLLFVNSVAFKMDAQVTIGEDTAPNSSAVLDLRSKEHYGLLLPRLALASINDAAVLAGGVHVVGLFVYNTATAGTPPGDVTPGIYYNDGNHWVRVDSASMVTGITTASNGLNKSGNDVRLGGTLTLPTTITATALNTLALAGLQVGALTDSIVMVDASGVLRMKSVKAVNSNDWHITGNEGIDASVNFLGTTDDNDLVFKRDNIPAGWLSDSTRNTAFGVRALPPTAGGGANTAIGYSTLTSNTSGSFNTAIGNVALFDNTTGSENVGIGHLSMTTNTTGGFNTAVGVASMRNNTEGVNNTAVGWNALAGNTTGGDNSAVGGGALFTNTEGFANSAFGGGALNLNRTGTFNSAFGLHALMNNVAGHENSAFGVGALNHSTQNFNSAFGNGALASLAEGERNTAVGFGSLIGYDVAGNPSYGNGNTSVGAEALRMRKTGDYNTALGTSAGREFLRGDYNIIIGANIELPDTVGSNQLNIGDVIYGTNLYHPTTDPATPARIGIGTDGSTVALAPTATLDVNGTARVRNLPPGTATDSVVTADAAGNLKKVSASTVYNWFYLPSFNLDLSGTTVDLYNDVYKKQFTLSTPTNPTFVLSDNSGISTATATNRQLYGARELAYIVTYYDDTVLDNISINEDGVMTYNVTGTPGPDSYINIVCVVK